MQSEEAHERNDNYGKAQRCGIPDLSTPQRQAMVESALAGGDLLVLDNLSCLCRSGKENEGESWHPLSGFD